MAVDLTPGAHFQRNTTGLVLPVTFCAWVRPDTTPAQYRVVLYHGATNYSDCLTLNQLASGVVSAEDENFSQAVQTGVLTVGVWYFLGVSVAAGAGNFKLYWRAEGEAALSSDTGTFAGGFSDQRLFWGTGPGDTTASTHSGAIAYARAFATELSEAQILAESQSATAVATEWADWPFATAATSTADVSGNSRTLTFNAGGGSQADDTDPDLGGAAAIDATFDAALGGGATAAFVVEHPASFDSTLGGAGSLAAVRDTAATATADLGLTAAVTAVVDHPATATGDLGTTANLVATVEHPATLAADPGFAAGLTATVEGDDVAATLAAGLGATASAALTIEHPAAVSADLGATAGLSATVERSLTLTAGLGFTAGLTVAGAGDPNPTVIAIRDRTGGTLADRPIQRLREPA